MSRPARPARSVRSVREGGRMIRFEVDGGVAELVLDAGDRRLLRGGEGVAVNAR